MQYDTIIWDIDGTLIDTQEGLISSYQYVITKNNLKNKTKEQIRKFIGPTPQDIFKNVFNLDENTAQKYAADFRERYKNHDLYKAKIFNGTIEVLELFKKLNIKQAIATNKREDYAKDICKHFQINKYCNPILGMDNYNSKTKSELITECIKKLNSKKAIMIGDTTGDKIAAMTAGVDFLGVNFGFGFSNIENYANSPSEIPKFINFSKHVIKHL